MSRTNFARLKRIVLLCFLCVGLLVSINQLQATEDAGFEAEYRTFHSDGNIAITAQIQEFPPKTQKTVLKIGVLAKRGKDIATAKWQPHVKYLSRVIPEYDFQLIPLDFNEVEPAIKNQELDFILTNPGMYVNLETQYGVNRIASLKNLRLGKPYIEFGGVILTQANRDDINELRDFKGKTFMGVNQLALAAWQSVWDLFLNSKVDPYKDFKELSFAGTQDKVVIAVVNGAVDGGAVRTDTVERMAAEGKIKLEDLKVINQQEDTTGTFPFLRSTPLYPEWPFAATKNLPLEIEEQVAKALLNMPPDSPAAIAARIEGWTVPLNYRPVHELFIDLKVAPYENLGEFTTEQLIQRLAIVMVAALIIVAAVIIYFQKRSLIEQKQSEKVLNELNKSLEKSAEEQRQQKEQQRLAKEQQRQAKEQLETAICTLIDEISDAAEGNLTVRANLDSLELSTVADLFNAIIGNLQDIAIEARQSSSLVGDSLKQNESAIRLLAQQAIAEAQETRKTLISVQQMSQSIQEVAHNANKTEQIVDDTYNKVLNSTKNMDLTVESILNLRTTVRETAQKMERLGESSQKVSQALSFIQEIALKTNILAINCRNEAERAGEYGRGFATLAEQVGALAKQCTTATPEIAQIFTTIQDETKEVSQAMKSSTTQVGKTTSLVKSTKDSLSLVLEKSQTIDQLMGSISQSTILQADTSQNVTNLMQKIAQLSETISKSSQQVAKSIRSTAQVAAKLQSTVAQFKVAD